MNFANAKRWGPSSGKIWGIILLSGCGHYGSDAAFEPYVEQFRAMLSRQNVAEYAQRWNVELKFGTPDVSISAECDAGDIQREIIVDRGIWDRLTDIERRVLIFHELGHCVLGRKHTDGSRIENAHVVTDSIMFPNALTAVDGYKQDPERYEVELTLYSAKKF